MQALASSSSKGALSVTVQQQGNNAYLVSTEQGGSLVSVNASMDNVQASKDEECMEGLEGLDMSDDDGHWDS